MSEGEGEGERERRKAKGESWTRAGERERERTKLEGERARSERRPTVKKAAVSSAKAQLQRSSPRLARVAFALSLSLLLVHEACSDSLEQKRGMREAGEEERERRKGRKEEREADEMPPNNLVDREKKKSSFRLSLPLFVSVLVRCPSFRAQERHTRALPLSRSTGRERLGTEPRTRESKRLLRLLSSLSLSFLQLTNGNRKICYFKKLTHPLREATPAGAHCVEAEGCCWLREVL